MGVMLTQPSIRAAELVAKGQAGSSLGREGEDQMVTSGWRVPRWFGGEWPGLPTEASKEREVLAGSDGVILLWLKAPALNTAGPALSRYRLTERESQVAMLLAGRASNKEIAKTLGISTHTAWRHTENVMAKLGVNSRRHVLAALTGE